MKKYAVSLVAMLLMLCAALPCFAEAQADVLPEIRMEQLPVAHLRLTDTHDQGILLSLHESLPECGLMIIVFIVLMGSSMSEVVEVNAWGNAPVQSIKAASVFLSAIPMILAYPFIQKYFTKGTMLGSVKG